MIKKKSDTSQETSIECNSSALFAMLLRLDLNFKMIFKKYWQYKYFKWLFR